MATAGDVSSSAAALPPGPHQNNLPPPPCDDFGVAILCALPVEATAVGALFEERWDSAALRKAPTDTNAYSVGTISSHRVVVAHMPGMGKVAAATVAGNLRSSFPRLRLVLLVGICGGAPNVSGKPSDELLLGDVVVSTGVVQYDLGRRFPGRFVRKDTPHDNLSRLSVEADALLAKLQTEQDREQLSNTVSRHLDTLRRKLSTAAHPGRSEDKLFRPDYLHKHHEASDCLECAAHVDAVCDEAVEKSCDELKCSQGESNLVSHRRPEQSTQPVVHFGLVASGDTVMRSGRDRDDIARRDSVIAFEMEGAGMWEVLRSCSCLIIKSVCDYADSHKNKKFQAYAAAVAAATAKALLQSWGSCIPSSLQPVNKAPVLNTTDIRLLNKLKAVPYPDRKDRNPHRTPGTCEWFVNHGLFRDWLETPSDRSKALWVSADPGCGKSVLAKYLVDHVLQTTAGRTTCYFFFKDDFEDQKNVANAISCILHQLFTQKPVLFSDDIRAQLEAKGDDLTLPFCDLWDLLLLAAGHENAGEILCVLDALDECKSDDRQELATALLNQHRTKKAPNLRFLLTSRPYGFIRRSFQPPDIADLAVVHLSGENEAEIEQISKEIDIFIKARIAAIGARLMLEKDEQDMLLRGLLHVPHRTYLWVYLTLGLIEGDEDINRGKLRRAVSQLPRTVSEAYEKVLSTSRDPEEARKVLHIIVAAKTPLTLREMNFALALRPEHHSYDDIDLASDERFREQLRDICGLFVAVIDSRLYLLHQTAKEFLVRPINWKQRHRRNPLNQRDNVPKYEWKHSLDPADSHRILGQICLWLLQFPELLSLEAAIPGDFAQLEMSRVFLDYSASYWYVHLRAPNVRINKQMTDAIVAVCQACHDHYPFWFISDLRRTVGSNIFLSHLIDRYSMTPLMLTSFLGLASAAKALINTGSNSDLHVKDRQGKTALAWAAASGHHDVVKVLLDTQPGVLRGFGWLGIWRPAGLEIRDEDQRTPLMWAVINRHESVAKLLLDKGADIEATDNRGDTPLLEACKLLNEAIIKLLLEKGADVNAKNGWGGTPLIVTCQMWRRDTSKLPYTATAVARLLIEHGADVNAEDENGKTALSRACQGGGNPQVAELLRRLGAKG